MGKEQLSSYYDRVMLASPNYNCHYRDSIYFVLYTQVLQFVKKYADANILEVGCGPGHLAQYLFDEGFRKYGGFDFSGRAVEEAQRRVKQDFFVGDALDPASYDRDYNLVIALEVLEHLQDDLKVLRLIRQGSGIIFSVPVFDDPSHVRFFSSKRQVERRYYKYINIVEIYRINAWFVGYGTVEHFNPSLQNCLLGSRDRLNWQYLKCIWRKLVYDFRNLIRLAG